MADRGIVLLSLPGARADRPSGGTWTVMRTVTRKICAANLTGVEVPPILSTFPSQPNPQIDPRKLSF